MSVLLAVLWKDLISEWRSRDRAVAMLLFALLVAVVFHFALPSGMGARTRELAPGLLWVAYVFAAVLGLNRAFSVELENDALTGLALVPRDRGFVFLGKAAASFVILAVVQAITAFVFAVVFELGDVLDAGAAARLAGVVALGSLGVCTVGTLFAAIAVRTRFREVMLPLLLLPLLIPVLSGSVRATADLLLLGQLETEPLQLLLVADAVYLIASFVGFEYVLDE
jgi:heme exporter protein B